MEVVLPEKIGPYRIEGIIGRGSMGVVYRGVREDTGQRAAIKTVLIHNPEVIGALRREIRALAGIARPGIVKIIDDGMEGGAPWYAMELLEDVSLRNMFNAPGRDMRRLLSLLAQLCDALAHLHGEGFVHRDLKPENIIVTGDERAVLVDFGLASLFAGAWNRERLTIGGFAVGTVNYMPPEQILGEIVDARADLYSVGCILFETITGKPPFEGSIHEVVSAHLNSHPKFPENIDVPQEIKMLTLRLLGKDPHERPGYASYVASELRSIIGEPHKAAEHSRDYLYRPRLSGRDNIIQQWEEMLDQLESKHGGIFLLGGESGSGKTRLLQELSYRASHRTDIRVLTAECVAPFSIIARRDLSAPFSFALRKPLETIVDIYNTSPDDRKIRLEPEKLRILSRFSPGFASLIGPDQSQQDYDLPPDRAQRQIMETLQYVFSSLSHTQPVLLVVDDIQWIDFISLAFLQHLTQIPDLPFTIVASYRSEEAEDLLSDLLRAQNVKHIRLSALPERAITTIVADMLATEDPAPDFVNYLSRQSEGNPFYVAEYLKVAVEQRLVYRDPQGEWQFSYETAETLNLPIPEALQMLVQRHLNLLSDSAQKAVRITAAIGREFSEELFHKSVGVSEDESIDTLTELLNRAVLISRPHGKLSFVHDKLREICYQTLEETEKQGYHRIIGTALEELQGTNPDQYSAIASHYLFAREIDRARPYALLAARESARRYVHSEATWFFRKYLESFSEPTAESVAVQIEFATVIFLQGGNFPEAREELISAMESAKTLKDPHWIHVAMLELGRVYRFMGDLQTANSMVETALQYFTSNGPEIQTANSHVALASIFWDHGYLPQAEEHFLLATEIFERNGNKRQLGATLNSLSQVYFVKGEYEKTIPFMTRALELLREVGDFRNLGAALNNLASTYWVKGNLELAAQIYQEALVYHRQTSDRRAEAATLGNLGLVYADNGDPEEAMRLLESAISLLGDIGDALSLAYVYNTLSVVLRQAFGDYSRSMDILQKSEELLRKVNNLQGLGFVYCERGHLALARSESAERHRGDALQILKQMELAAESELGQRIQRLEQAQAAYNNGQQLLHGDCVENIPPRLRDWITQSASSGRD